MEKFELSQWKKAGFTEHEASKWKFRGFELEEAKEWKSNGFELVDACCFRGDKLRPEEAKSIILKEIKLIH